MLKLSCQIFFVCIFSIQSYAADEYNFLDLDFLEFNNMSSPITNSQDICDDVFDPWGTLFLEETQEEALVTPPLASPITEPPAPHYINTIPNDFFIQGYFPINNFTNSTTIYINNYYTHSAVDPQFAQPMPMPIGEKPELRDNKRKYVEECEVDNKRPKSEPRSKIINGGPSKQPVIRAFLLGIENNKGGKYINQRKGSLRIDDLKQLLEYTDGNCTKSNPTTALDNRLKTLKRWFDGIPVKPLGKKFDITVKKEMKEKYRNLFEQDQSL